MEAQSSDEAVGVIVLSAAVGGLVGLWLFGALGGILGAIVAVIGLYFVTRRPSQ